MKEISLPKSFSVHDKIFDGDQLNPDLVRRDLKIIFRGSESDWEKISLIDKIGDAVVDFVG